MQIVDANVLIYATNTDAPHHETAHRWLDDQLSGTEAVGLPWTVLLAFARITTRAGLLPRPLTVTQAFDTIDVWLSCPNAVVPTPTPRHRHVLRDLLERVGTAGNLTADAHLAALALEHGASICSFDSDFARFPGLRWSLPTI